MPFPASDAWTINTYWNIIVASYAVGGGVPKVLV